MSALLHSSSATAVAAAALQPVHAHHHTAGQRSLDARQHVFKLGLGICTGWVELGLAPFQIEQHRQVCQQLLETQLIPTDRLPSP